MPHALKHEAGFGSGLVSPEPKVLGDVKNVREVENVHRAYELIDSIDPFDVSDLLRIHGVMTDGLIKDAGNFRSKTSAYTMATR